MRGAELLQERRRRRAELRRVASMNGYTEHKFLALDEEELATRADSGDASSQGNVIRRRLALGGLRQAGVPVEVIAAAWHVTPETLADYQRIPLLDKSGAAAAIERQVLEELPETPEPGRYVAPEPTIAPAWGRGDAGAQE